QRINVILAQNYEPHESPLPRLFVVLPTSYKTWGSKNLQMGRFWLHFLCECGVNCWSVPAQSASETQSGIVPTASLASISAKNSIHLAKHEGYELTQPIKFFDLYDLYVLGMLKILRHCLAVATVTASAAALVDNSVKNIMDGGRTMTESTMQAVHDTIEFLKRRLDDNAGHNESAGAALHCQEGDGDDSSDMIESSAALEGAELRRLDLFLRKKNEGKILGNLYRITTEMGHVKWVSLNHYRHIYRENPMTSFLQSVEINGGSIDPQLGKITIALNSSAVAKDFFYRLPKQAPAVISLRVTLNWSFGAADLVRMVDKVSQSNIHDIELDLQEYEYSTSVFSRLLRGKGKYHTLLDLLSSPKIKKLAFTALGLLGLRTSRLPISYSPSLLQSFHFTGTILDHDDCRLAEIILQCPSLVDLRLGAIALGSSAVPKVDRAIRSLSKLQILPRNHLYARHLSPDIEKNSNPYGPGALRDLVDHGLPCPSGPSGLLEEALLRSSATLEVVVLEAQEVTNQTLDLIHIPRSFSLSTPIEQVQFNRLTHLHLFIMTTESLRLLAALLPRLSLVSFGVDTATCNLLDYVYLGTLKSVSFGGGKDWIIEAFYRKIVSLSRSYQIESLRIAWIKDTQGLWDIVRVIPLKRLFLVDLGTHAIIRILSRLNFPQLKVLTIDDEQYNWVTESVLAG
ncbi:hypothetical protein BG015_004822, partial [Linnemannia schmuckeri]